MNIEDFTSEAYLKGQQDAIDYSKDPLGDMVSKFPNPYPYGTEDWQRWNLGWNHQIMRDNP